MAQRLPEYGNADSEITNRLTALDYVRDGKFVEDYNIDLNALTDGMIGLFLGTSINAAWKS